jgi:hypothetical protein
MADEADFFREQGRRALHRADTARLLEDRIKWLGIASDYVALAQAAGRRKARFAPGAPSAEIIPFPQKRQG